MKFAFCRNQCSHLKPSLKTMEEPHLRALIIEDLKLHPRSKISEIHKRVEDLDISCLRKIVYKMYNDSFDLSLPSEELNARVENIKTDKNVKIYQSADKLFEDLGI